jgi:PIN domain nuclease of toxin-antitoxin system
VRLLLDTHVAIWWDAGLGLSASARDAIIAADEVYVSAASSWEIRIKAALGKITTSRSLAAVAADSGFFELPVLIRHTEAVRELPALHRDPFDRLLVAQAIAQGLTLVTRDPLVRQYDLSTICA